MIEDDSSIRESLVRAYQRLKQEGFIYGSAGNVSVRKSNSVWITPSGITPEELLPEQICRVGIDGSVRESATGCSPSSEVPLHLEVYKNTSATAVVHGHSTYAVSAGLITDEIPNVHYVMRRLGGAVRVVPYAVFGSLQLANTVNKALRGRSAALLRNHGAVTHGTDLEDAMESYRTLEWVCEVFLGAIRVGVPASLSGDQLEEVAHAAEVKGYRL
ncbi:MAG: class II aldolase/adducin family protein [Leucobacter sp.]